MILLINICKEPLHTREFVYPIADILKKEGVKFNIKHYSDIKANDVKKSKKIIVCGTSLADNEFLKDIKKFNFLLNFKKPILGICGGAHILGLLLGYKLKEQELIGLKEINLEKEFLGIKNKIKVYHLHQFQVLPEVFHKNNFYATLFHPEVRNKEIITNFCRL